MTTHDLIGKTITNIYGIHAITQLEYFGLDTATIFVELNGDTVIHFPHTHRSQLHKTHLPAKAEAVIYDITDEMIQPVKAPNHQPVQKSTFLHVLWHKLFPAKTAPPLPTPVITFDKPRRYIKNRKITDIIWYPRVSHGDTFLQLDNGCIIGETQAAPSGTGLAGLNYYYDLKSLALRKGLDYETLMNK
ncbi:hypothetical protein SAMN05421788_104165 [Filimonas lacunae]|uniref:Uncharacterized protein n=1 Tax=Filimonas lacunae TaxID=477680 RepID=A0A173M9A2_9BACT|nr:hypothetical protein [Filimonas lacunae]BAV04099.1 hypothetical protein FLA_0078 [Filimonas lacunae]SIT15470.1 hypothetical protein SAMN05421788_104165 [Filimonas lacunae]